MVYHIQRVLRFWITPLQLPSVHWNSRHSGLSERRWAKFCVERLGLLTSKLTSSSTRVHNGTPHSSRVMRYCSSSTPPCPIFHGALPFLRHLPRRLRPSGFRFLHQLLYLASDGLLPWPIFRLAPIHILLRCCTPVRSQIVAQESSCCRHLHQHSISQQFVWFN